MPYTVSVRFGLAMILVFAAWGCGKPASVPGQAEVQLPPQQSEDRMAAALAGLSFSADGVRVAGRPLTNRAKSIRALQAAERAMSVDNTPVKAAGLFRDAILADPTYALPYEGLARALMVKGDAKVVEAALRTAIRLDPTLEHAHFLLGTSAQMRGDYDAALEAWKDLVAQNPDYPDAYARMAIAAHFQGDAPAAHRYLREADRRKQNVPPQFRELLREGRSQP